MERLVLRPFESSDAATVQSLAGDEQVASTTLNVPHPYEDGMAERWFASHGPDWEEGRALVLAITTPDDGVVGAMSLTVSKPHRRAEIGYWIGVPFWGRGYATEAAQVMVDFGFDELGLNRIEAFYLTRNPASGRVLEKVGMRHEGVRRQHIIKWGVAEDVALCAVLAEDRAVVQPAG